jgi:hypothetical protein
MRREGGEGGRQEGCSHRDGWLVLPHCVEWECGSRTVNDHGKVKLKVKRLVSQQRLQLHRVSDGAGGVGDRKGKEAEERMENVNRIVTRHCVM